MKLQCVRLLLRSRRRNSCSSSCMSRVPFIRGRFLRLPFRGLRGYAAYRRRTGSRRYSNLRVRSASPQGGAACCCGQSVMLCPDSRVSLGNVFLRWFFSSFFPTWLLFPRGCLRDGPSIPSVRRTDVDPFGGTAQPDVAQCCPCWGSVSWVEGRPS